MDEKKYLVLLEDGRSINADSKEEADELIGMYENATIQEIATEPKQQVEEETAEEPPQEIPKSESGAFVVVLEDGRSINADNQEEAKELSEMYPNSKIVGAKKKSDNQQSDNGSKDEFGGFANKSGKANAEMQRTMDAQREIDKSDSELANRESKESQEGEKTRLAQKEIDKAIAEKDNKVVEQDERIVASDDASSTTDAIDERREEVDAKILNKEEEGLSEEEKARRKEISSRAAAPEKIENPLDERIKSVGEVNSAKEPTQEEYDALSEKQKEARRKELLSRVAAPEKIEKSLEERITSVDEPSRETTLKGDIDTLPKEKKDELVKEIVKLNMIPKGVRVFNDEGREVEGDELYKFTNELSSTKKMPEGYNFVTQYTEEDVDALTGAEGTQKYTIGGVDYYMTPSEFEKVKSQNTEVFNVTSENPFGASVLGVFDNALVRQAKKDYGIDNKENYDKYIKSVAAKTGWTEDDVRANEKQKVIYFDNKAFNEADKIVDKKLLFKGYADLDDTNLTDEQKELYKKRVDKEITDEIGIQFQTKQYDKFKNEGYEGKALKQAIESENQAYGYQYLNEAERKLADINFKIRELRTKPSSPSRDADLLALEIAAKSVKDFNSDIAGTDEQIFDAVSGDWVQYGEATDKQKADYKYVVKQSEELAKTPLDKLSELYHEKLYETQGLYQAYLGERKGGMAFNSTLMDKYYQSSKEFQAINRAYQLNRMPDKQDYSKEIGSVGNAMLGFQRGFGNWASDFFMDGELDELGFRETIVKTLQDEGFDVPEELKKRAETTIAEEGGRATGTSLPIMGQMIIGNKALALAKGIGFVSKILDSGRKITALTFSKRYKDVERARKAYKRGSKIHNFIQSGIESEFIFQATGQDAFTGTGEFVGGSLGSWLTPKKLGALGQFLGHLTFGSAGQVVEEVFGDVASNIPGSESVEEVINKTFGYTDDERLKYLGVQAYVAVLFSSIGATGKYIKTKDLNQAHREVRQGIVDFQTRIDNGENISENDMQVFEDLKHTHEMFKQNIDVGLEKESAREAIKQKTKQATKDKVFQSEKFVDRANNIKQKVFEYEEQGKITPEEAIEFVNKIDNKLEEKVNQSIEEEFDLDDDLDADNLDEEIAENTNLNQEQQAKLDRIKANAEQEVEEDEDIESNFFSTKADIDAQKKADVASSDLDADKVIEKRRKDLGGVFEEGTELFDDMDESVATTMERAEQGTPTDVNALQSTSDYLYEKYNKVKDLNKEENKAEKIALNLTTEEVITLQSNLEADIDFIENQIQNVREGNDLTTRQEFDGEGKVKKPSNPMDSFADKTADKVASEIEAEINQELEDAVVADVVVEDDAEVQKQQNRIDKINETTNQNAEQDAEVVVEQDAEVTEDAEVVVEQDAEVVAEQDAEVTEETKTEFDENFVSKKIKVKGQKPIFEEQTKEGEIVYLQKITDELGDSVWTRVEQSSEGKWSPVKNSKTETTKKKLLDSFFKSDEKGGTQLDVFEKAVQYLNSKKVKMDSTLNSGVNPIEGAKAVYNAALSVSIGAVKGAKAVSDVVAKVNEFFNTNAEFNNLSSEQQTKIRNRVDRDINRAFNNLNPNKEWRGDMEKKIADSKKGTKPSIIVDAALDKALEKIQNNQSVKDSFDRARKMMENSQAFKDLKPSQKTQKLNEFNKVYLEVSTLDTKSKYNKSKADFEKMKKEQLNKVRSDAQKKIRSLKDDIAAIKAKNFRNEADRKMAKKELAKKVKDARKTLNKLHKNLAGNLALKVANTTLTKKGIDNTIAYIDKMISDNTNIVEELEKDRYRNEIMKDLTDSKRITGNKFGARKISVRAQNQLLDKLLAINLGKERLNENLNDIEQNAVERNGKIINYLTRANNKKTQKEVLAMEEFEGQGLSLSFISKIVNNQDLATEKGSKESLTPQEKRAIRNMKKYGDLESKSLQELKDLKAEVDFIIEDGKSEVDEKKAEKQKRRRDLANEAKIILASDINKSEVKTKDDAIRKLKENKNGVVKNVIVVDGVNYSSLNDYLADFPLTEGDSGVDFEAVEKRNQQIINSIDIQEQQQQTLKEATGRTQNLSDNVLNDLIMQEDAIKDMNVSKSFIQELRATRNTDLLTKSEQKLVGDVDAYLESGKKDVISAINIKKLDTSGRSKDMKAPLKSKLRNLVTGNNLNLKGLIYMTAGKNLEWFQENIVEPLTKARWDYFYANAEMQKDLDKLKKDSFGSSTDAVKFLKKDSDFAINKVNNSISRGQTLTNDQVVYAYNLLKQGGLSNQMKMLLGSEARVMDLINYVNNNKGLKTYADGVTDLLEKYRPEYSKHSENEFNRKLEREIVTENELENDKVLKAIYGVKNGRANMKVDEIDGQVYRDYTPIRKTDFYEDTENKTLDELLGVSKANNVVNIHSGNLAERQARDSAYIDLDRGMERVFKDYTESMNRSVIYTDITRDVLSVFDATTMSMIEKKFGKNHAMALQSKLKDDMLRRNTEMSRLRPDGAAMKWLSRFRAGKLAFKPALFLKQQFSQMNYLVESNDKVNYSKNYAKMWTATSSKTRSIFTDLFNDSYTKNRLGGSTQDVSVNDLLTNQSSTPLGKAIDKSLNTSMKLVSWGDISAVLLGGTAYVETEWDRLNKGITEQQINQVKSSQKVSSEEAYEILSQQNYEKAKREWVVKTEETQQSTDVAQRGTFQNSTIGRIMMPYSTSQQQYMREAFNYMRKARNSKTKLEALQNVGRAAYYGVGANAMFVALSTNAGAFMEAIQNGFGDDEDKEVVAEILYDSLMENLKARGMGGQVLNTVGSAARSYIEGGSFNTEDWVQEFVPTTIQLVQPLAMTYNKIKQIDKKGMDADKAYDLVEILMPYAIGLDIKGVNDHIGGWMEMKDDNSKSPVMRALGWSAFSLGEEKRRFLGTEPKNRGRNKFVIDQFEGIKPPQSEEQFEDVETPDFNSIDFPEF